MSKLSQTQSLVVKTTTRTVVKWVLALIFGAAAAFYVGAQIMDTRDADKAEARRVADSVASSERVDSIVAQWREAETVLLGTIDSLNESQQDLRAQRDGVMVTVSTLRRDLSKASTKVDTIRLYGNIIQAQDTALAVCGLEVTTCLEARAKLDSLYQGEREAHDSTKAELDTLRVVTTRLVDVTNDCKYGQTNLIVTKFCNPSPTVTFLVGAGVGVVATCALTSCLGGESTSEPVIIYAPNPPPPPHDPPNRNPKD